MKPVVLAVSLDRQYEFIVMDSPIRTSYWICIKGAQFNPVTLLGTDRNDALEQYLRWLSK